MIYIKEIAKKHLLAIRVEAVIVKILLIAMDNCLSIARERLAASVLWIGPRRITRIAQAACLQTSAVMRGPYAEFRPTPLAVLIPSYARIVPNLPSQPMPPAIRPRAIVPLATLISAAEL
ncbi:MAG: hypothetical protein V1685_04240 [Parcubacteria group bacterium]